MEIKIGIYGSLRSTQELRRMTLEEIVGAIRTSEKLKRVVEVYRTLTDKAQREPLKQASPAFLPASLMSGGRGVKHITALTGYVMVDIDDLEPSQVATAFSAVCADCHTAAAYVTISGCGVRVIAGYDFDDSQPLDSLKRYYRTVFNHVNNYYARLTGLPTDDKCKDPSRLSVMTFDEDAFFNAEAVAFSEAEVALESSRSKKRKVKSTINKTELIFVRAIEPGLKMKGVAFAPGSHNDFVMRTGYELNKLGVELEDAVVWAVNRFGADYPETEKIVRACYNSRPEEHGVASNNSKSGGGYSGLATLSEIADYLKDRYELRFNVVKDVTEFRKKNSTERFRTLDDRVTKTFAFDMSGMTNLKVINCDIDTVVSSRFAPDCNPVIEYLDTLPEWTPEQPDYIAQLAATVTVAGGEEEQQYFCDCLRKWLVAMVGSWMEEDFVNQVVLTLIGPQSTFKSSWFYFLMPPELREYYTVNISNKQTDRDFTLSVTFFCLVNIDELDYMDTQKANDYKRLITMPNSNIRAFFEKKPKYRVHLTSFCATGNNPLFLNDQDEGRRWMPFTVEEIVQPREFPFNHTGIYSQAKALFQSGFRSYLDRDEVKSLTNRNSVYRAPALEEELIGIYFRKPGPEEIGSFYRNAEILQNIGGSVSQKLTAVKVGLAMKKLGFEQRKSCGERGWICIMRSLEEVKNHRKSLALHSDDNS